MAHTEPRGVLWDVDGTLVDSSAFHFEAWRDIMRDQGYHITEAQFVAMFGRRNDDILRVWIDPDIDDHAIARIADVKEARYRELMQQHGIAPLPGVVDWLRRLHEAGWRQAITSSAPRLNVAAIVRALAIEPYFDALVSAEDVQRGKPDPQVFLVGAARLGIDPPRCIVVEDVQAGIDGAHRAGMRAIGVLTTNPTLDADLVVPALDRLPHDAFERLLGRGAA